MRNTGIAKWRFIDPQKHEQAVKALPLGSETPFEVGELREPWMKRVLKTIGPRLSPEEKWARMKAEYEKENKK